MLVKHSMHVMRVPCYNIRRPRRKRGLAPEKDGNIRTTVLVLPGACPVVL